MVNLNKLFNDLQRDMHINMNKECPHGPSKGDITEEQWRQFFVNIFLSAILVIKHLS